MVSLSLQQHREGRRGRNGWLCLTVILAGMIFFIAVCSGDENTLASVRDLRSKLFEHYDKLVRPVVQQTTTTTVYVELKPLALVEMDEDKEIMEMDTWMVMKWKDEYLVWNPEEYGGVTTFNIPSTELWRPDVTIYTGSPAKKIMIEVFTNAIINYTGDVLWVPPVAIRSRCPQDANRNQDTLICTITMGSWTYHEYRLDIQLYNDEVKLEDFSNTNPYWELISAKTERKSRHYSCCPEPYPSVDYNITLRRRSTCRALRKSCSGQQMSHHHCSFTP